MKVSSVHALKSSVHHLDRFRINHIFRPSLRFHFHQIKRNNTSIDNLFCLGWVLYSVRKKELKEIAKPYGMTSHNYILFLNGSREDKIAKIQHANQTIRVDGFVAGVKTHIGLAVENVLKVAQGRRFFNPRGLNVSVCRCNGKSIRIATDWNW